MSGVCDTHDNLCGYANGDGPCTVATGGVVCRSGVCSVSGVCMAAGSCDVDADCTGGDWCFEATHTCTPKLANGTLVPTDPTHTSPTLNGVCTAGAAALVCASAVCDPADNKCGLANGDGPCTVADGPVVCRAGICNVERHLRPHGRVHQRRRLRGGQLVRRDHLDVHAHPRERLPHPDGSPAHEPDAERHVQRRRGGARLHEPRLRHGQRVRLRQRRRPLHGGDRPRVVRRSGACSVDGLW